MSITNAEVALDRVRMAFGSREVFRDLTCTFPGGRISIILGGSGSGKSTILRLIGGLVRPQAGRVVVEPHQPRPIPSSMFTKLR